MNCSVPLAARLLKADLGKYSEALGLIKTKTDAGTHLRVDFGILKKNKEQVVDELLDTASETYTNESMFRENAMNPN